MKMNKKYKKLISLYEDRDITWWSIFNEARENAIKNKALLLNMPFYLGWEIVTLQYDCITDDLFLQISVSDRRCNYWIRFDKIKLWKYIKN